MSEQVTSDQPSKASESRGPTLIFVSHDSRDAELAEAFSKLLSSVSAGVLKTFRSSDRKGSQGIEYGVEWYPELMSKLETASDVVCLLPQRSMDRPWILYEAGVAKGKLNTPVYGIALGIPLSKASSGPFAQFQNCDDEEDNLTKLVMQLVRRIPGSEPDREAVEMQVRTFKERTAKSLAKIADSGSASERHDSPETSVAKLFEEVKVMFQDLPSRIESRVGERPQRSRKWRRMHPMMLEEMSAMIGGSSSDPIALLFVGGLVREDFPWLYELCIEAYRVAKTGDALATEEAFHQLRRAMDFAIRGPFSEEVGMTKEMHVMMMELPMLLDHFLMRFSSSADSKAKKAAKLKSSMLHDTFKHP